MARRNVSPSPLVWMALALMVGTAGRAEPISANRLAQWLSLRLTDHAVITAVALTADQWHIHMALAPANGAVSTILFENSRTAPGTEMRGRPHISLPASADRAPPDAPLPTRHC